MSAHVENAPPTETIRPVEIATPDLPVAGLFQMLLGFYYTQLVYVAAALRLPDLLAAGPKTVDTLAAEADAKPMLLYRVMRAMAGVGLVRETDHRVFENTQLSEFLRSDVAGSIRAYVMYQADDWHWRPTGRLLDCVRTGKSAFELVHDESFYEYVGKRPQAEAVFDEAMRGFAIQARILTAALYDFSGIRQLVDVGGGQGAVLSSILQANHALTGVLFDRDEVVAGAGSYIAASGLQDRCEVVGGSFFDSVPEGGDAYMLSFVLLDFPDDEARAILSNIRMRVPPDGRLLLLEMIVPDNVNEASFVTLADVELLVSTDGTMRTKSELEKLLQSAGFNVTQVVESPSPVWLVEARPI